MTKLKDFFENLTTQMERDIRVIHKVAKRGGLWPKFWKIQGRRVVWQALGGSQT
jgi:hypothetical protein